jgi:hypothetical protein
MEGANSFGAGQRMQVVNTSLARFDKGWHIWGRFPHIGV